MKKIMTVLTLGLVISILGFHMACVPKTGHIIKVANFLTDPVLIKITQDVIADIQKKNPDIKIEMQIIPYDQYQEKITTLLAAGSAPDVIYVEVNDFVDLNLRGVLEDLTPYVQADKMNMSDYYQGVLGRFTRDGKIYAIPQDTAPQGLVYYNKKVFQEAGVPFPQDNWSWPKDFLVTCQKLVKKDASGKIIRWAYTDAYPIRFDNFLYSSGANFVDDTDHPTRMTLDDPKAVQAIQYRYDLINKYHVSPTTTQIQSFNLSNGVEEMFINGQVAMMSSGIWHTPQLLKASNLDFDVVQFPTGPTGIKAWGTGGSGFAMSKTCTDKQTAWKVIRELTSVEVLSKLCGTGMIQPALKSLANSDVFLKAPGPAHKTILLTMPDHAHYEPFLANWPEIMTGTFGPAMDPVWLGEKTPVEVLPGTVKTINEKFFSKK